MSFQHRHIRAVASAFLTARARRSVTEVLPRRTRYISRNRQPSLRRLRLTPAATGRLSSPSRPSLFGSPSVRLAARDSSYFGIQHIYVISLTNSPRRASLPRRLGPLQSITTVFPAVNGASLSLQQLTASGVATRPPNMSRGQYGCFLSHVKVLQLVAAGTADPVLIAEDDAGFEFGSSKWATAVALVGARPWAAIFVGATLAQTGHTRPRLATLNNLALLDPSAPFYGLMGYIIHRDAARAVHDHLVQSGKMHEPVDILVHRFLCRTYPGRVFSFAPALFTTIDSRSQTEGIR
eukprot:gnl/Hemi2/28083_TR9277_c0_g1_i1.p1 gnl/Hemi2/28083_TR9277_c0_g1~~gnl/Hemi2/28083_TR9277_c0_g1_i1.p1  ORF type:complete len:294 (-),score=0.88 gnl/Hemi2/28083_TR9277_c0_g1_i1:94-975(-)